MHCLVVTCVIAMAASCIAASPLSASASPQLFQHYKEFHRRTTIPQNWEKQGPAPPDTPLHLKIGLTQQNVNAFHQKVVDTSTPGHPSYGMHMRQDEIDAMLRPADDSAQLVLEWFRSHNIQGVLVKHSVEATITVAQANKLLQTHYSTYRNIVSGHQVIRTMAYSLPTIIADHVDYMSPTTSFPREHRAKDAIDDRKHLADDPSCLYTLTMRCLQNLYRVPQRFPPGTSDKRTSLGVVGFDDQYANYQDLQSFLAEQQPDYVGTNFTFISINGGLNNQNLSEAGSEANIDIQIARGLAPEYETLYYFIIPTPAMAASNSTDNSEYHEILLDYLLAQQELPHTLSISYGGPEQDISEKHAQRVCTQYAQLGMRGTSVIVGSGDSGVADGQPKFPTSVCYSNDVKNVTRFVPVFPASCPFVTSVGATTSMNPEIASTGRFYSGGGFSRYFPRPSYQDTAVNAYLSQLPRGLYDGLYNAAGRGIPDVAAQGEHYQIWYRGKPALKYGTSASAPTFAAVITHLNGQLLSQGKKPMGFLNPWLYGQGREALNDILSGSNPGCGTDGFAATPGWDAVTGLGTPDYVKMLAAALLCNKT